MPQQVPGPPGLVPLVQPQINTPFENLAVVMAGRQEQEKARILQQEREKQERAVREQAEVQRIMAESGGDWYKALPRIKTVAPGQAVLIEEHLAKQRNSMLDGVQKELDNDAKLTERHSGFLRVALHDPEGYQYVRSLIMRDQPDVGQLLPEQHDPAAIERVLGFSEPVKDYHARNNEAIKLAREGKLFEGLGTALSVEPDQEGWDSTIAAWRKLGTPEEVIQRFGAWGPGARERAAQLAMSPKERADVENAQAGREIQQGQLEVSRERVGLERQRVGLEGRRVAQSERGASGGVAGGPASPADAAKVRAIMKTPALYGRMTPSEAQRLMPALEAAGFDFAGAMAGPSGAGGAKLSAGQVSELETMATVRSMAKEVQELGDSINWEGVGGWMAGTRGQVASKWLGKGTDKERSLRNKISNIKATIAKLRGGSAFTPNEQALLESYTPTIDDSDEDIQQKLRDLVDYVNVKERNLLQIAGGASAPASGPVSGGAVTVQAPDGSTHSFATQAEADRFMQLAGIR